MTERYARQALLPFVGREGQERLGGATAVVVGLGALGSAAADLLARAGVGRLRLIDRDIVEWTNLQRQGLYTEADARAAAPKAEAARARLAAVNSEIEIEAVVADATWRNVDRLLPAPAPSVVLDCSDNYETRYLLNDWAAARQGALVYGGVVGAEGMALAVLPGRACLRCLWPEPPRVEDRRTCDTAGVFGPSAAVVGSLQAASALKILLGREDLVPTALTRVDLESGAVGQRDTSALRDPACPCCGRRDFAWLEGRLGAAAERLCGRETVQVSPANEGEVDLAALEARLRGAGEVSRTKFAVRGRLAAEGVEIVVFADGRALVNGTRDAARARAVVARYVG